MEGDFGILPLPKYDVSQEKYRSPVNPYSGAVIGVPPTVSDFERTGIILEAMAAESRYTLLPAYYDTLLMRKYIRDDESSDMLDIIFSNIVYDTGAVYNFGNVFTDFIGLASNNDRNVISLYERRLGVMEKDIAKTIDLIESMY